MSDNSWSVPESTVLTRALELVEEGRDAVLVTIIAVEGNAYRRPGAKMLVTVDGEGIGNITAGCLEDEVLELAEDVLAAGSPRHETFDLMEDDDDVWGLGLGCNGIIDVLLEPLDDRARPALEAYAGGEPVASVTLLDGEPAGTAPWQRTYVQPDGSLIQPDGDLPAGLASSVAEVGRQVLDQEIADVIALPGDGESEALEVFAEAVVPPPRLLVLGTGPDVRPVIELAGKADFRTTIAGFRGGQATPERFPEADEIVATSPASLGQAVDLDASTYTVVMTHNFLDDRLSLEVLLESPVPYIGLMGPRERFEKMLDEFEAEGRSLSKAELDRVYTPVGVDLGGGTPYQIAVSIVAELLAVHYDRRPVHLTNREGPIHGRIDPDLPT